MGASDCVFVIEVSGGKEFCEAFQSPFQTKTPTKTNEIPKIKNALLFILFGSPDYLIHLTILMVKAVKLPFYALKITILRLEVE